MNNDDYIRKAVELADGWYITHIYDGEDIVAWTDRQYPPSFVLQSMDRWGLDALAAQLVRQVDALEGYWVKNICCISGDDRTLNTIKAIVNSGVLEQEQNE